MTTVTRAYVSRVAGLLVFDPNGDRVGKARDVVVALRVGTACPRVLGLVGVERTVQPVVRVDRATVDATLDANRPTLEKAAVEGGVHYDGATPVADLPAAGQRVARDAAMATLADRWLYATPVSLPLEDFSPTVSADVVRQTVAGAATRAVAGPLTFRGTRSTTVRVEPAQLGAILTFGSALLIVILTLGEFLDYRRVRQDVRLEVDHSRQEKLEVHLNVTFPRVPCYCACCGWNGCSRQCCRSMSSTCPARRRWMCGTS